MVKEKILLVDDEQDIIEFLGYNLTKEGYDVTTCTTYYVVLLSTGSYVQHQSSNLLSSTHTHIIRKRTST